MKTGTRILFCERDCRSEYQDKRYGPGKRVHNGFKDGWRCSVCEHEVLDKAKE